MAEFSAGDKSAPTPNGDRPDKQTSGACGSNTSSSRTYSLVTGSPSSSTTVDVSAQEQSFKLLTAKHAIRIAKLDKVSNQDYAKAVGQLIGPQNIMSCNRAHNSVILYLSGVQLVDAVCSAGLGIAGTFVKPEPLVKPSTRVVMSNVDPFIPNHLLIQQLSAYGKVLVNTLKYVSASMNDPSLKHIVSHRREVQILLSDEYKKGIDGFINVKLYEKWYKIYVTTDHLTCFKCKSKGHTIKFCPETTQEADKTGQQQAAQNKKTSEPQKTELNKGKTGKTTEATSGNTNKIMPSIIFEGDLTANSATNGETQVIPETPESQMNWNKVVKNSKGKRTIVNEQDENNKNKIQRNDKDEKTDENVGERVRPPPSQPSVGERVRPPPPQPKTTENEEIETDAMGGARSKSIFDGVLNIGSLNSDITFAARDPRIESIPEELEDQFFDSMSMASDISDVSLADVESQMSDETDSQMSQADQESRIVLAQTAETSLFPTKEMSNFADKIRKKKNSLDHIKKAYPDMKKFYYSFEKYRLSPDFEFSSNEKGRLYKLRRKVKDYLASNNVLV